MTAVFDPSIGDNFRATMRRFPATVTIVTARDGSVDHGMTVTAVTSVSMEPPSLVVCINNRTLVHELLINQPVFAVNVLNQEQKTVSEAFAGREGGDKRFERGNWVRHERGVLLLEGAHAQVVCRRIGAVPSGTHTLFIGQVLFATVDDHTRPLLYENAQYVVSKPAGAPELPSA